MQTYRPIQEEGLSPNCNRKHNHTRASLGAGEVKTRVADSREPIKTDEAHLHEAVGEEAVSDHLVLHGTCRMSSRAMP